MIVFARTRWSYDSYADFWRLVELSGFPTCYVDEINLGADAVYVTTPVNGEVEALRQKREHHLGTPTAKVVWWNLERPDAPNMPPPTQVVSDALSVFDRVWVSDRHYRSLDARQQYLTLGSHPLLRLHDQPVGKQFDYAHMSYVHGRRIEILARLRQQGLREAPCAGPGETRDQVLRESRVMLNTHQTPVEIGEPIRIALTAAYRLPLVSEHLRDPYPLVPGMDYVDATADELPAVVRDLVRDDYRCAVLGENLYRALCVDRTFQSEVQAAAREVRA